MDLAVIVPIVIALIAPVGAYFLASRRMSGKIATSEASELWKESANIRDDYRQRLDASSDRQRDLEKRVATLESANNDLLRENYALKDEIRGLKNDGEDCKEKIADLHATIRTKDAEQRAKLAVLEASLSQKDLQLRELETALLKEREN